MISRDRVIDENESWNWTCNSTTNKPLLNSLLNESYSEEEDEIHSEGTIESVHNVQNVQNEIPPRTRVVIARLKDCEVIANNEVIKDRDLIHFAILEGVDPINHNEAFKTETWKIAMTRELVVIGRNNTWKFVKLPSDKKAIEVKWVCKLKHNTDGLIS